MTKQEKEREGALYVLTDLGARVSAHDYGWQLTDDEIDDIGRDPTGETIDRGLLA